MAFAVGVDFGSTKTTVAISQWDNDFRADGGQESAGARVAVVVPSVLFLGENHELAIGDHAQKLGASDPHRVIRDFKRRLGDSVPVIADGWSESTESLIAALVRRAIDEVADQQGAPPDAVALAVPGYWGPYKQTLLKAALEGVGLADVLLVSEPVAAISGVELPIGDGIDTVLVYDLGAGSFDAAVMTRSADGEFACAGIPQGLDWLGGDDFDQAIFSRVRDSARVSDAEQTDAELLSQMSRLRVACTQAKEALSLDTEVTIPVATTRYRTRIRLVRAEFEELIRDAIEDTLDAARRVISSAGLAVNDIDAIVLVGGSARIPLVAQMISAEFSLPIMVGSSPEATISMGAARISAATLRAEQTVTLVPVPAAEAIQEPREAEIPPPDGPGEAAAITTATQEPVESSVPTPAASTEPAADRQHAPVSADPDDPAVPIPVDPGEEHPAVPSGALHPNGVPFNTAVPTAAERSGRHRRHSRRRGLRTAGIIAATAALIFAGSSLVASQAADSNLPITRSQSGDPVQTTSPEAVATTTAGSTPGPSAPAGTGSGNGRAAVTPPSATPGTGASTAAPPTPATTGVAASTVNAPAIVVDNSGPGGSNGTR